MRNRGGGAVVLQQEEEQKVLKSAVKLCTDRFGPASGLEVLQKGGERGVAVVRGV